jgi:rhodanese-related sulfurtransferase
MKMLKYFIGAVVGGVLGFFVIYKLIGCSSGSCPITANPYISTIYGIILGVLVAGMIATPVKDKNTDTVTEPLITIINETTQAPVIEYKKITANEAKARIDSGDNIIILDVRTAAEYESGHIQNAILIPNETITDKIPALLPDLDAEILIYCRSGNRSAQAAKKLIAIGYTNVYDFGGIIDWPYDTVTGS